MVLVTGATGILGRVIVLELLKRGKKVRATKRPTSDLGEVRNSYRFYVNNSEHFFNQIEWVDIDIHDVGFCQSALQGVEEVYHCAAFVSFDPADSQKLYQTNIEGTKCLLYACEGSSVKKFCHVSSIAVLDGLNESGELDEDASFNPKITHSPYAISKQNAEMEVWRANAEGLETVILNPGLIIGSGNWAQSSGTLFQNFQNNRFTFGGGTSYVDVRDVAKIAVELMDKNIFGQRFVLVSETLPYAEVSGKIRKVLGLSSPKIINSKFLKAAQFLNAATFGTIPGLRMADKANIEAVISQTNISSKKVKKILGYSFIPVSKSIDFHLNNYIADQKKTAQK